MAAAEVKRLLHEIAFALRSSREFKLEILAGPRRKAWPLASENDGVPMAACAA
jgi:hypothetical protein